MRTCKHCGKELPEQVGKGRKRMFCSVLCQSRWYHPARKEVTGSCIVCGGAIEKEKYNVKYCSLRCRQSVRKFNEYTCCICGKQFKRKEYNCKCCSKHCAAVYRQRAAGTERPMCKCGYCGKMYKPKATERTSYCSRECAFKKQKEYYGTPQDKKRYVDKHATKRRHALRKREREVVSLKYLRERDNNTCQLCGKKVRDWRYPHPMSPSIDHIIPVANGGTHTKANCQLAHLGCNQKRRHIGAAQTRLCG